LSQARCRAVGAGGPRQCLPLRPQLAAADVAPVTLLTPDVPDPEVPRRHGGEEAGRGLGVPPWAHGGCRRAGGGAMRSEGQGPFLEA